MDGMKFKLNFIHKSTWLIFQFTLKISLIQKWKEEEAEESIKAVMIKLTNNKKINYRTFVDDDFNLSNTY